MKDSTHLTRRQIISAGAAATGIAGAGAFLSMEALAQDKAKVNMQLGWIAGGNQIAEVAAKRLGYYEQEGIDFAIQPGGPSIDGVAIAFTLGAGGADTSHKPPPLKRVCPVKPAPEHIVFVSL